MRKRKKFDSRQIAFTRFMLIVAVFAIWILGIGARLVHLQVSQHDWLSERASEQRQDIKRSKLLRGTIYDRDEHPLAISVKVRSLYADPREITDIDATAKILAHTLKINAGEISAQLRAGQKNNRRFVSIAKKLDEEAVQKLNKALYNADAKKADEPQYIGLHWIEDQRRTYPYHELAAQVIGFANSDDEGQSGIEQSQDDLLHGAVIKKLQERDRLGRVYDETIFERDRPADVVLSLSTSIQYKIDQALEQGVKAANAASGMAVAIDPKTGEILGMSNYPSYDPEKVGAADPRHIANNVIQSVYSPGSVFKLVTYGSALERDLIKPDDMIDAGNGTIEVANHTFTDSHHVGYVNYAEALAHSSNVCAIKTGLRVGKEDFFAMLQKMGFGAKTGVELPAETVGIVRRPDRWNGDSLASMSIGYEIGVTALQMATAFATIANDGIKVQPRIIREIRRQDEAPVRTQQTENTRVVSSETAADLRRMLRQVVLTGTGKRAQLSGYTAAGKTGTAWKYDAGSKSVDSSKYISSFIGMAPANDPRVVIAVVIDEPKVGGRDGGMVAAPIFKTIAEQILPELGVAPDAPLIKDQSVAQDIPETVGGSSKRTGSADVKNGKEPAKDTKSGTGMKPAADRPRKANAVLALPFLKDEKELKRKT